MNLISKKELLALTGISYGQLYRWKRERLIPEAWFIKQSSYTGQETFFPREQILSRVRTILEAKDRYSLEELAGILSPETSQEYLSAQRLAEVEEISPGMLPLIDAFCPGVSYEFFEVVLFAGVSQLSATLSLTGDGLADLLRAALSAAEDPTARSSELLLVALSVGGTIHAMLCKPAALPTFSKGIAITATCDLSQLAGQMKLKDKSRSEKSC